MVGTNMSERNRFQYMKFNKVGRTTQLDEGMIMFPRKEEGSPRHSIYKNECPDELHGFQACMDANNNQLAKCSAQNLALEQCGNKVFKVINAMDAPYDYAKGLPKN